MCRRSHPIVPVLGDDDQRLVVTACASGVVCARDAAITLLAVSTGLRACDIVDLRLSDVDWRGRTISIVQRKTGNPLTVPLTELLACRLADYVLRSTGPTRATTTCFCAAWPRMFGLVITPRYTG